MWTELFFWQRSPDSCGPALDSLIRSLDRCERAYPVGLWVAAGPNNKQGTSWQGLASRQLPRQRPKARAPVLGVQLSSPELKSLCSAPPCLGVSDLVELLGRKWVAQQPCAQARVSHQGDRVTGSLSFPAAWRPSVPCPRFWRVRWPLEASQDPAMRRRGWGSREKPEAAPYLEMGTFALRWSKWG